MKNSYFMNPNMNSVVSLDLDSSWAAKTWDLSQWYMKDPTKIRLKNASVDVSKKDERGGKVRQLFEERRGGAGRDKSYPLEPLKHRVVSLDRINYTEDNINLNSDPAERETKSHNVSQTKYTFGDPLVRKLPNLGSHSLFRSLDQEGMSRQMSSLRDLEPKRTIKKDTDINSMTKSIRSMAISSATSQRTSSLRKPMEIPKPMLIPKSSPISSTPLNTATSRSRISATASPNPNPKPKPPSSRTVTAVRSPQTKSAPKKVVPKIQDPKDGRVPCSICGRYFLPDRIGVHEKICKKATTKKRKAFDPVKHRLEGTEAEPYIKQIKQTATKPQPARPKVNWRAKHEEFINAIRAAKEAQVYVAKGGKLSDLPPPPPLDTSDYVQCPHCARKFNQSAADRHIPKCASMRHNKPKTSNSSTNATTRIALKKKK